MDGWTDRQGRESDSQRERVRERGGERTFENES